MDDRFLVLQFFSCALVERLRPSQMLSLYDLIQYLVSVQDLNTGTWTGSVKDKVKSRF